MRVAIAVLAIVGGLAIQASTPAYAWYDRWGRWHPNYYHPDYYHPHGYHPYRRYGYGYSPGPTTIARTTTIVGITEYLAETRLAVRDSETTEKFRRHEAAPASDVEFVGFARYPHPALAGSRTGLLFRDHCMRLSASISVPATAAFSAALRRFRGGRSKGGLPVALWTARGRPPGASRRRAGRARRIPG